MTAITMCLGSLKQLRLWASPIFFVPLTLVRTWGHPSSSGFILTGLHFNVGFRVERLAFQSPFVDEVESPV